MIENRFYKVLLLILALLTGYSRIYLSQHFLEDVYAGSIIGVSTTFLVYYFVHKKEHDWMDGSIVNFFNK
jgi:membrane-associated phospholipid phosphatase